MAKQRLRQSRLARQARNATGATSDMKPDVAVDATLSESGGKRHGKRLQRKRRTSRVESVAPERVQELAQEFGAVDVEVKTRGRAQYATLVVYTDASRIVPRD